MMHEYYCFIWWWKQRNIFLFDQLMNVNQNVARLDKKIWVAYGLGKDSLSLSGMLSASTVASCFGGGLSGRPSVSSISSSSSSKSTSFNTMASKSLLLTVALAAKHKHNRLINVLHNTFEQITFSHLNPINPVHLRWIWCRP